MKALRVDEVSLDRQLGGRVFPFKLSGKARAVPIRVCVRLEIADVSDGFGFVDGPKTGESEIPPRAVPLRPVERRLPTLLVHRGPAERKPEFRSRVAAGFHEGEILAIRANGWRGVKALRVDEVSLDRHAGGGMFPFKLSRQTRSVPIRVGVRLEIADVSDGFGFVDGPKTGESEIPPGAIALHPVERRFPPA